MGQKLGAVPLLGSGSCVPIKRNVAWIEAYLHTKWHRDPSTRLGTIDMGRKLGGSAPLGERDLGPHLTHCDQGQGLPARQVLSGSVQPFGHSTPALQTGQDRYTGQTDRQWSGSIGPTVLQTVTQKQSPIYSWLS